MQKNHAKRTALALFLLFAVTVSAQAAKIAEVIPIGHTVGIKMQAEGVLIVQLTEVQGAIRNLRDGGGRKKARRFLFLRPDPLRRALQRKRNRRSAGRRLPDKDLKGTCGKIRENPGRTVKKGAEAFKIRT